MDKTKTISNILDLALLILSLGWGVFSYFCSHNTGEGMWFSRSGSVMVLICVIVEYRLGNLQQIGFKDPQKALQHEIVSAGQQAEYKKYIDWFAHFQIVIGTIIWGYGDLLF